ncbi:APC family permease [Lacticaseibacillus rhamnosus]|uniref:APC family permease n=1 Tax=Lacticaseibacillus rhamnosus TaxID=47715 RepID=UPI0006678F88|nr:APC family permease [Lacticaseibacillus rhamnosus]
MNNVVKKEQMGYWSMILLGINGIIGSGIFLLPNQAAKLIGSASIFVLLFDALLVISIALCFAQAATYFDRDGGPYLYAKDAFGDFVGFEVGFVTWAIRIIAEATMAVAFTTALVGTFPALNQPIIRDSIISVMVIGLALMNIAGVRVSTVVNNVISVSKLVPLVLFVAIGIFFIKGSNFTPLFPGGSYKSGSFGQAAVVMFYAFTGFEGLVVAAGDMKNAKRNLPKAVATVMTVVSLFYILIQVVSTGILGNALASTDTPIQTAFAKITGGFGNALVAAGTLLSTGGLLVASSFITPRSGVALAENHMMPQLLAKRNRVNSPYIAIIVSATITLLIAYSGTFGYLAQISAVSRFAQYIPTCLAVIVFAKTKTKDKSSTFHLPLGPVIPAVAILVSIWLLVQVQVSQLVIGLGALLVAVPFYFLTYTYRQHGKA